MARLGANMIFSFCFSFCLVLYIIFGTKNKTDGFSPALVECFVLLLSDYKSAKQKSD